MKKFTGHLLGIIILVLGFSVCANAQIDVSSSEELIKILKSGTTTNETVVLQSGGTYNVTGLIRIPENFTIDLNRQTVYGNVPYVFSIYGNHVSVKNGTISGSGIRVDYPDPDGVIEGLTVQGASDYGIYVCQGAVIGGITGNIVADASVGIDIQKSEVRGDVSNNTITGCRSEQYGAVFLNGSARVSGSIVNNTILDCMGHGIFLHSQSSSGDIKDNVIRNVGNKGIVLMGNSASPTYDGSWCGDIIHNELTNVKAHGISIYHGSHVGRIRDNVLVNIGGRNAYTTGDYGITINSGTPFKSYATEIIGNTLENVTNASIVVFAGPEGDTTGKWQDNAYITGDIAYNTVKYSGTVKKNEDWKKSRFGCQGAIYVDSHAKVDGNIHDNTIITPYDDGINVLAYSSVNSIYNNTITNPGFAGIAVSSYSTIKGKISNNTVKSSGNHGIFINNNSVVKGGIIKNIIKKTKVNGIFVTQSSKVGAIKNNDIKDVSMYGITASGKGSVISTVAENTVTTSNAKEGYPIFSNEKCIIKKITNNVIGGKYLAAIRIKAPNGKVTISGNTMKTKNPSSARSVGMSINDCKKKITITKNKITGNGTGAGINIRNSSSKISKNKYSNCKKDVSES